MRGFYADPRQHRSPDDACVDDRLGHALVAARPKQAKIDARGRRRHDDRPGCRRAHGLQRRARREPGGRRDRGRPRARRRTPRADRGAGRREPERGRQALYFTGGSTGLRLASESHRGGFPTSGSGARRPLRERVAGAGRACAPRVRVCSFSRSRERAGVRAGRWHRDAVVSCATPRPRPGRSPTSGRADHWRRGFADFLGAIRRGRLTSAISSVARTRPSTASVRSAGGSSAVDLRQQQRRRLPGRRGSRCRYTSASGSRIAASCCAQQAGEELQRRGEAGHPRQHGLATADGARRRALDPRIEPAPRADRGVELGMAPPDQAVQRRQHDRRRGRARIDVVHVGQPARLRARMRAAAARRTGSRRACRRSSGSSGGGSASSSAAASSSEFGVRESSWLSFERRAREAGTHVAFNGVSGRRAMLHCAPPQHSGAIGDAECQRCPE